MTAAAWVGLGSAVISALALIFGRYDSRRTASKKIVWQLLPSATSDAVMRRWRSVRYTVVTGADEVVLLEPRVLDILIENVGRNAVTAASMSIPPRVAIADGRLVDVEVSLLTRGGIDGTLIDDFVVEGNGVRLAALTLNPRDAVRISLLVDGGVATPTVTMQAVDFEFARKRSRWTRRTTYPTGIAVFFALVAIAAFVIF
ncbi:hypothetical protein DFJ67_2123 [Asanoa ferruginea]|uniref:Uncharacterized protein n=1 Tax=Asanoa ferruginea TaxID=53367 RepID=A0A3D9ZI02_9ACTN|nr:hypothetical protein [Asanoa ferruginea]REF96154.1 hypothetical protein DFJ67_2123 [Asanoa ferruginea]GIF49297.1 hypothetical protein Afe04nite_38360 [Asanoa ferruginea]